MIIFQPEALTINSYSITQGNYLFNVSNFRDKLAIFSLKEMDSIEIDSVNLLMKTAQKSANDSSQAHILIQDKLKSTRFDVDLGCKYNFNKKKYLDIKSFNINPKCEVTFPIILNTIIEKTSESLELINRFTRKSLVPIQKTNLDQVKSKKIQFTSIVNTSIFAIYKKPYQVVLGKCNDLIFQVQETRDNLLALTDNLDNTQDWEKTDTGQKLLLYESSYINNKRKEKKIKNNQLVQDNNPNYQLEDIFKAETIEKKEFYYLFSDNFSRGINISNLAFIISIKNKLSTIKDIIGSAFNWLATELERVKRLL